MSKNLEKQLPPNINKEILTKHDIQILIEVSRSAVMIQSAIAEQHNGLNNNLKTIMASQASKDVKINSLLEFAKKAEKDIGEIDRALFKFQLAAITGGLVIIAQIVAFFLKR